MPQNRRQNDRLGPMDLTAFSILCCISPISDVYIKYTWLTATFLVEGVLLSSKIFSDKLKKKG